MSERFWNSLRKELTAGGVLLCDDGALILDPELEGNPLVSPGRLNQTSANLRHRAIHGPQQLNWVRDLTELTKEIAEKPSVGAERLHGALWLRLFGVLVDIRQWLEGIVSQCNGVTGQPGSILFHISSQLSAIEHLRAQFDEDELLWVEYRRHVEAHVWQRGFEPEWRNNGTALKDSYASKITGQIYGIDDLNERLSRVFARYETEARITVDFATRLRGPASSLLAATERFCGVSCGEPTG